MVAKLHSRYVSAMDGFVVAGVAHSGAEALRAAGFSEVGTLWQRGNNRILCGVRGG